MIRPLLRCAAALLLCVTISSRLHAEEESRLVWGINCLTLPAPFSAPPDSQSLLTNQQHTALLNRFYRAGGENRPATPTECRIGYDLDNLYVAFRCTETNLAYPALPHGTNWYAQLHTPADQDASYPDKVDLFLLPDCGGQSHYHFAATLDGLSFGAKLGDSSETAESDDESASDHVEKTAGFETQVVRKNTEWDVYFRIPWRILGGKPASSFGFIPVRTRWRDGEVSSPVAADFGDRPPLDLSIETHFSGKLPAAHPATCLCRLPSGTLRWQRPAVLTYPKAQTIHSIWQMEMERSLSLRTLPATLGRNIYLTQRWTDLLELEGFCFRPDSGSISDEKLFPSWWRKRINGALRARDPAAACRLLDSYLGKLDSVSKRWFADGSPGDVLANQWSPVTEVEGAEEHDGDATIHCRAGNRPVDLHLSFPSTGGIRLWANGQGYFKPSGLLPVTVNNARKEISIFTSNNRVVISKPAFGISFSNKAGNNVTRLASGSIAFRFDAGGKVLAADFKSRLEKNEVIYGFGERYDHFNENGNVLTLWGVDAWSGNTAGLRNLSYKPVPLFHSSKGYSVFVNSSYRLRADIGQTSPSEYRLTQQGPVFDYFFWITPPAQAIESYTALTGKPILPPKWAFEPWMGRTGRAWSTGPLHDAVNEEEQVVNQFALLDIPHSAIYSEGPGADSPSLNAFMAGRGEKVLSWYFSSIEAQRQAQLLPELKEAQLPILRVGESGSNDPTGYVDFTHPEAMELSRRWWKSKLDLGVAGSMVDFGDRTPESAVFHDGRKGGEMHNFYSYDYQRVYHDVFAERRGNDFVLLGRAAAPGTQQWAAQFAGDHPANSAGLKAVLTGALNLCACGFSTWGSDLGGFLGSPDPAVYMRWTQFACFSPLMRSHGRTPREPWEFGQAAIENYKYYAWVRENLIDYIYTAAETAHQTGVPMMRSMAVAYPEDVALAAVSDQYMFGPDLLVSPMLGGEETRQVLFPPGHWTSLWDGKMETGPGKASVSAPLDRIPVYLKEGATLPVNLSASLQWGDSMTAGKVPALIINPAQDAARRTALGTELQLTVGSETHYAVIYASEAAGVSVDGVPLPRQSSFGEHGASPGWRFDPEGRRVIVCLPSAKPGRTNVEIDVQQGPASSILKGRAKIQFVR